MDEPRCRISKRGVYNEITVTRRMNRSIDFPEDAFGVGAVGAGV